MANDEEKRKRRKSCVENTELLRLSNISNPPFQRRYRDISDPLSNHLIQPSCEHGSNPKIKYMPRNVSCPTTPTHFVHTRPTFPGHTLHSTTYRPFFYSSPNITNICKNSSCTTEPVSLPKHLSESCHFLQKQATVRSLPSPSFNLMHNTEVVSAPVSPTDLENGPKNIKLDKRGEFMIQYIY